MGLKDTYKESDLVSITIRALMAIASNSKEKSGTYDKADPTAFYQFHGEIFIQNGYTTAGASDGDECPGNYICPIPEIVSVRISDVTWGIEFIINSSKGEDTGYYDAMSHTWCRVTENFFTVLADIVANGETPSKRKVEEDEFFG